MNTIQSRFERFSAFLFSSASSFEKGADLWDAVSHYDMYLTENGEPGEALLLKLEEMGCSRSWLLYANGEMFADNEQGRVLRYKFMNGIGLKMRMDDLLHAKPSGMPAFENAGSGKMELSVPDGAQEGGKPKKSRKK